MFGRLYLDWLFGSCPVIKRPFETPMYRKLIRLVCFFLLLPGSLCVHLQAQETAESEGGDPSVVAQDDGTAKPLEDDTELVLAKKVTALVQEGEARDALELIEASLADPSNQFSIRDIERSYAVVAAGFSRIRNNREAFKILNTLFELQLKRLQQDDSDVRIAATVRAILAMNARLKKLESTEGLVTQALQAVERIASQDPSVPLAVELADMRGIQVSQLVREKKLDEAFKVLKAENERLEKLLNANQENRAALNAYAGSISNLMRFTKDSEERSRYFRQHQALIKQKMNQNPDEVRFVVQFLAALLFQVNSLVETDPKSAMDLVSEGEKVVADLSITNPDAVTNLQQVRTQLQNLKNRAEAQEKISQMMGKPAPNLDAEFWVNGTGIESSDLEGKVVLIDFWAMWSRPCVSIFPTLNQWNETYAGEGLQIIGVTGRYNLDWDDEKGIPKQGQGPVTAEQELEALSKFYDKVQLRFPTLVLPKGSKMPADFAVAGIPYLVLIDKQGNLQMAKVGANKEALRVVEDKIKELLAD